MSTKREVVEGHQRQGKDETVVYTLTTTNWGSSPSSPTVIVYDVGDNADELPFASWTNVTSTVASGNASATGDVITLPAIASLTAGRTYRVEVSFASGSSTLEPYFYIDAEN